MSSRTTNCPNCGGQVEFKAGTSLLSVCPYCNSAVARVGDDITELEILGQVAPLAELASPLSIGTSGRYANRGFTLVGRLQLNYGLGPWNEWYAAFDDGQWAWIAEAQGRVYITFAEDATGLPGYAEARVGSQFTANGRLLSVTERRRAKFVAAEGELPFAVEPGSEMFYCDVEGPDGVFGTLDYASSSASEPDALFLGVELEYGALFDADVLKNVMPGQAAGAVAMNCPNCGAGVEVRAPDSAQRVTCGACESLLDCSKGTELFLLSSARSGGPEPVLPLGDRGRLFGRKWTVFGQLVRSVTYDGIRYAWQEYLLRDEGGGGYRWLLYNDGHWTWVEPMHAGDVSGTGRVALLRGQRFRHYQSSSARVDALRGEFYWKVAVGEQVGMIDFIRPPQMLSREASADEVTWSLGAYIEKSEIEKAFGLKAPLPGPRGVAPHQPNPHGPGLQSLSRWGLAFTGVLLLLAIGMSVLSDNALVLNERVMLRGPPTPAVSRTPRTLPTSTQGAPVKLPFSVNDSGNLAVTVTSDVKNAWLYVRGRLVNESMSTTKDFGVQVTYHSGYAGGTSWTAGGRQRTIFLGSMSSGDYTLTLTPEWSRAGGGPTRFDVAIRSQVFIGTHAVVIGFFLWLLPLIQALRYYAFEKRRWAESDHA